MFKKVLIADPSSGVSVDTNTRPIRIGAVRYLNTKPLVYGLSVHSTKIDLSFDYPSRLADKLAAGNLDIALIPSVEFFLGNNYQIVSDACIGCRGPVWSVKLFFRKPPSEIKTLALDEGSRTSAALAKILLKHQSGVSPDLSPLPVDSDIQQCNADAVLLIGDRAIHPPTLGAVEVWDLGQRWIEWTGYPFVFAMWCARPGVPLHEVRQLLVEARNHGMEKLAEISRQEACGHQLTESECFHYFHDNLHFYLGTDEQSGLERYYELAADLGLVAKGKQWEYDDCKLAR